MSVQETRQASKQVAQSIKTGDFPDLHTGKVKVEKKIQAATAYILEGGNVQKAAKAAGVHPNSIFNWKKEDWWYSLIEYIKKDFNEDLKVHFGSILRKASNVVEDRLENGDQVLNYKTGAMEYRPISGKDAATILGIISDKSRVMDGLPNSITENKTTDQRMEYLAEQFEKIAKEKEARTIEGDYSNV